MFRNQFDTDCITWSPQGRIFQIEYAMAAVTQGSAVVALRGKDHAVLCSLKRSQSELASYQKKIFNIDENMGIGVSGLTPDARVICNYMRNECLNHKYVYDKPMQVGRLVEQIGAKSQLKTQRSGKRPYGVGLLIVGYDSTGPHVYETCPSGNYFEYKSMAIGGRCQSAKTYLEKNFETFDQASLEELVTHAVKALKTTTGQDLELSVVNTSVAVVGKDVAFKELSEEELTPYIEAIKEGASATIAPMDTS